MSQTTLLITGARGYLGAHLIRELAARPGAESLRLRLLDNFSAGSVRALTRADLCAGTTRQRWRGL